MNKRDGKDFLLTVLIGHACILLLVLINNVIFQVCVWSNMDHEIAWHTLKIFRSITIPFSAIVFLASLPYRFQKNDLTKHFSKQTNKKITAIFEKAQFSVYILFFVTGFHVVYVEYIGDEYVLARAQAFHILINHALMVFSEVNIGFFKQKI